VSVFPYDGDSPFDLVRTADVAMYHAKAAGGKEVHFFSAAMRSSTEAKQKMENDLRGALENDELFLMYQPRQCLKSGKIAGVEALLRWRHPEMGVLLPGAFLASAEESGLIVQVGQWVLEQVCLSLRRLQKLGHGEVAVSMNASYREFVQQDFISAIGDRLRQFQLSPASFELELREEHLMQNPHLGDEIANACKALDIRLTIDDFGAGQSNLSYLQKMPVQHLKMGHAAVSSISSDHQPGALAKSMIDIGHNLEIGVIAEGVETRVQRDFLHQHGCDQLQGYIFSPPVEMGALEQLLAAH
jgi:EAL domain-containing protein (putative c-di-GMP-specific phosphodiesterase class I)